MATPITGQSINAYPVPDNKLSLSSKNPVQNKVISGALADEYSASKTYAVGDLCIHDGVLYSCTTDITTAEVWNAAHWETGKIGDTVNDLNRQLGDVESELGNVYYIRLDANIVNPNTQSVGALNPDGTVNTSYTNYLVSDFIPVDQNSDYTYTLWTNVSTKSNARKYIALYNANKEYIDDSYQNVTGQFYVTFNTSSAAYVRVSSANDTTDFLSKGSDVPSSFVEYSELYINKLEFDSETIPQSAIDFDDYFIKANNINLYNQNTDVNGYIGSSGAVLTDSDSYKTTDYIAVRSTFKYFSVGHVRFVGYYDSNKIFISRDVDASYNPTITPTNSGFIRVTYYVDNPLTSIEEVFDGTATKKIEEGIALSHYQLAQAQEELTLGKGYGNILYGKKWAVCGDSFTNSGGTGTIIQDGKYAGKAYTYPWLIGNRNNMDIVQFFGGGRTLAFPAEPGSFVNSLTCPTQTFYYQNIPTDVDYITIYLGINDRNHSTGFSGDGEDTTGDIPLGTVDDTTTETYLGAYNVVLKWLITNRPNAHIGMIVTNGIAAADSYRQGQIAIAQKYGIPYIDMNGDSRTPAMLRTSNPNIPEDVKQALITKWAVNSPSNEHPNDAAQLFESTFIENFLRSI